MKLLKFGLRFWITITSIFSFLTGWILLAHAPKPTQSGSQSGSIVTPLPTLAPLQPLSQQFEGDDNNFQNQPSSGFQSQTQFRSRPFFSTGGS